jgi:hypothetical protein
MTLHMQGLTTGLNILSILKDCGRICSGFNMIMLLLLLYTACEQVQEHTHTCT